MELRDSGYLGLISETALLPNLDFAALKNYAVSEVGLAVSVLVVLPSVVPLVPLVSMALLLLSSEA